MSQSENLDILAHPRSTAVAYFTNKTLPAAGVATDPNAGTLGNGLAVPVPSWARSAMIFISYAVGAGGDPANATAQAHLYAGAAVGTPLVLVNPTVGDGSIGTEGSALLAANIGGAGTIGIEINETGDPAHPGVVSISIVFSQ